MHMVGVVILHEGELVAHVFFSVRINHQLVQITRHELETVSELDIANVAGHALLVGVRGPFVIPCSTCVVDLQCQAYDHMTAVAPCVMHRNRYKLVVDTS